MIIDRKSTAPVVGYNWSQLFFIIKCHEEAIEGHKPEELMVDDLVSYITQNMDEGHGLCEQTITEMWENLKSQYLLYNVKGRSINLPDGVALIDAKITPKGIEVEVLYKGYAGSECLFPMDTTESEVYDWAEGEFINEND